MSAVRRPGWMSWLAVFVVGLTVVGCSKPVPTEAEIVGTWVSEGTDGWGEPGGTIVFNADGTFTAIAVPQGLLTGSREATPIDGEGTWSIDDGSLGSSLNYYDPGVQLIHIGATPGVYHSPLYFAESRFGTSLTYRNDYDIPERYIFEKDQ